MSRELEQLENRVGYHFRNRQLLENAMTHSSYANEHKKSDMAYNERLEYLGDAVLELTASEYLFKLYPEKKEGELSKLRASMVCEPSLAKCARDIELPDYIRLGKGEEMSGGRARDSIISDAFEALLGAVFLDSGFAEARKLIREYILTDLKEEDLFSDRKSALQEMMQNENRTVTYELLSEDGPDHDKRFTLAALIDGEIVGKGTASTKKAAAQLAAEEAITRLKERK